MPLFGERKVDPTSACEGAIEREPRSKPIDAAPVADRGLREPRGLFTPHPRRTPRVLLALTTPLPDRLTVDVWL